MDYGLTYLKETLRSARNRFSISSPEMWFMLSAVLITVSWIFNKLIGFPDPLTPTQLMLVIKDILFLIMHGFVIYLVALLSIYLDERMRLSDDSITSSNFTFTRLFTPIVRAFLLLAALLLITSSVPSLLDIYNLISGVLTNLGIPLPVP